MVRIHGSRLPARLGLLAAVLAPGACWAGPVVAQRITSSDSLLSGWHASGRVGDVLLENDHIAVVISDPSHPVHASSGGHPIDAATASDRRDELREVHGWFDQDWPRQAIYATLTIVDDGGGGGPAVVRVEGVDSRDPDLVVRTDYSLSADAPSLVLTTTLSNTGSVAYTDFDLGDALLWGDCQPFAPGLGPPAGTTTEPWLACLSDQVAYGVVGPGTLYGPHGDGWSDVVVHTGHLGPGQSLTATRHLVVGAEAGAVATAVHALQGLEVGSLGTTVLDATDGWPLSHAQVHVDTSTGEPYLQLRPDWAGQASTTLPTGSWRVRATADAHLPADAATTIQAGDHLEQPLVLFPDPEAPPIGDTLSLVRRPLPNVPSIVSPGDGFEVWADAPADTAAWAAELRHGEHRVALDVVTATHDPATGWWTVQVQVPEVPLFELYDLVVQADEVYDEVRRAVSVIPAFEHSFYFVHLTDTHLPTHWFSEPGAAPTDTSELSDLRAVIADINLIRPAFVLLTGDLINEGELEDHLHARYFTRTQEVLSELEVPLYLVAGNHDIGGWQPTAPPAGTARLTWWRFFGWRRSTVPGAPWPTQDYAFDYGPVHLVGLESYDNYDGWLEPEYGATSFTAAQLQWLADDLSASEAEARVLFYHYDFAHQLDLDALGVDLALWGHVHSDRGSLESSPMSLATAAVCDEGRHYRLVRWTGDALLPSPTLSAGATGRELSVSWDPPADGTHPRVQARIDNRHPERFEHGLLRFLMPRSEAGYLVEGGTLAQVDTTGEHALVYVDVDIGADGWQAVSVATYDDGETGLDDTGDPGDRDCGCTATGVGTGAWLGLLAPVWTCARRRRVQ